MDKIRQKYSEKGFEIIAVNLDKDRSAADAFLKKLDVSFTLAFDQSGDSAAQYKLKGMPTSYLIGRDGKVYASHIGFRDKDKVELEKAIVNLINRKVDDNTSQ
jgi:peroxiredoxin